MRKQENISRQVLVSYLTLKKEYDGINKDKSLPKFIQKGVEDCSIRKIIQNTTTPILKLLNYDN